VEQEDRNQLASELLEHERVWGDNCAWSFNYLSCSELNVQDIVYRYYHGHDEGVAIWIGDLKRLHDN
jgi:hypothetical protein